MAQHPSNRLRVIQIGATSSDLPGTLRLFAEALGFQNAGAQSLWGRTAAIQGLAPDTRALVWWMVGRQEFFQLELFYYTRPVHRPKRADWKPSDHGWSRFGVAVIHFDRCLRILRANGITTTTPPITEAGLRRVAFLEPYLMTFVELLEKGETGDARTDGPEVVYATSSVSDIESARRFYRDTLGFEVSDNTLHRAEHEALWDLPGATRDSFLARGDGETLIEIVQYHEPAGRPRAHDYRNSDQGIMNICIGARDPNAVRGVMDRVIAAGFNPPLILSFGEAVCCYLMDPDREIELSAVPESLDMEVGFAPRSPFFDLQSGE